MATWATSEDLYSRYGDEFVDKVAIRRIWDEDLGTYVADESTDGKEAVISLALEDAKNFILYKLSCHYSDLTDLSDVTLYFPVIKQWHILLTIQMLQRGGDCTGCACVPAMEEYFKCGNICSENGVCLDDNSTFISASEAVFCCERKGDGCGCC